MSDEQKQPELAGRPAVPAEDLSVATEPAVITVEAPGEAVKGAVAQVAEAGSATTDVSVTDDRELGRWNEQVRRRMRHKSRRSFLGWGAGVVAGFGAFRWLTSRREIDGLPWPFRTALEVNEELAHDYFSAERLSPTFAPDRVGPDRVNGDLGLDADVDVAAWKLRVEGLASEDGPLMLGLNGIQQLPRLEMIAEFKCIEGWSVVVRWAGTRFTDFMKAYPPQTRSGTRSALTVRKTCRPTSAWRRRTAVTTWDSIWRACCIPKRCYATSATVRPFHRSTARPCGW